VTIKQLIVGFEGDIATIYVVWLRSLAGIGLLHVVLARRSFVRRPAQSRPQENPGRQLAGPVSVRPFPNLLT
jgi:hypothetical protein